MRYFKLIGFFVLFAAMFANITVPTFYSAQQIEYEYYNASINNKSYAATLRVYNHEGTAVGTGTYFSYKGKGIIVTASHVVGYAPFAKYSYQGSKIEADVVYNDVVNDIAILYVGDIPGLRPIKFRTAKRETLQLGEELFYAGFPNNSGPYAITGTLASFYSNVYVMQAYAWPGSSGSSVFDKQGRIVGVLIAVEVGAPFGLPQLISDVAFVTPIEVIEYDILEFILKGM
jgi:S1-C subfamily serine protease